jgi:hypothetical protein
MLVQLHHQYPDGHTDFVAQNEFTHNSTPEENTVAFQAWTADVGKRHPLPDGCNWLACEEASPHFVWAAVEG